MSGNQGYPYYGQTPPRKRMQIHTETDLWALVRSVKEAFSGHQFTALQEQEIGRAITDAYRAGREAEKKIAEEREAKLVGHFPWP